MILFWAVVLMALLFAFSNGLINGGGLASAVIETRAMEPLPALITVAVCEVLGLLVLGGAVAHTLTHDLMNFPVTVLSRERLWILLSALVGALAWNASMGRLGLPSSSTHALVGGLAGATLARFGPESLHWLLFARIFLYLGLVPACGILASLLLTRLLHYLGAYVSPGIGAWVERLQISALVGAALTHGSNDGQKSVAMILLALPAAGAGILAGQALWGSLLLCGLCLGAGTLFGSHGAVRTVGRGFYRLQTIQGLSAETSTMMLLGASSWAGVPMSTSHVMSASVLGAGIALNPRHVRWGLVGEIVGAWLVTVPAAGLTTWLFMKFLGWVHVVS
jgi:inorganic phosphate transporter, PiT family